MNSNTITRLYDQLSSKLGKETAENLITFIEQKIREEAGNMEKTSILMEKPLIFREQQESGRKIGFWAKFDLVLAILITIEVISLWVLNFLGLRK